MLPEGQRRHLLKSKFDHFVKMAFGHKILSYDEAAARIYSDLMGLRKEMGRPISIPDGQIASIARVHGYSVATRNIKDFEHCGLELINPFTV